MKDKKTSKDRIGERHPILLMIARAILGGGLLTVFALFLVLQLTQVAVAKQEYKNAHAFQPVHMNDYLKTH